MKKNLLCIALCTVLFAALGCHEKGTMEKAGERTDEIIDNVKDGDPILHKKGAAEKAGEAVDDTVKKVTGED